MVTGACGIQQLLDATISEMAETEALLTDICMLRNLDRVEFLASFKPWVIERQPYTMIDALGLCSRLVNRGRPLPWEET